MATTGGATSDRPTQEDQTSREVAMHIRTGRLRSIRLRLMLPIVVATVGLVALGAAQAQIAIRTALNAQRAQVMASTAVATVRLQHELAQEAAEADALRARGGTAGATLLTAAQSQTDLAATRFGSTVTAARAAVPALDGVLSAAETQVATLSLIRADVKALHADELSGNRYDDLSESLIAVADALPAQLSDPAVAAIARGMAAIGAVEHLAAEQRDLLRVVFRRGSFAPGELAALAKIVGAQGERLAQFTRTVTAEQQARYAQTMTGDDVLAADKMRSAVLSAQPDQAALRVDPDVWYIGQSNTMRRLDRVQVDLSHTLDQTARSQQSAAQASALTTGAFTALLIVLAFGGSLFFAIRTSRRLRRLRRAALAVANSELPGAINTMSGAPDPTSVRGTLHDSVTHAGELTVPGSDEIGEVGAALSTVHRQALRLAADQALLRLDISGLFVALSRRGQTLIHRQLQLIDEFARAENDPQRLSRIFNLDHLAGRMRRNEENLLVLAGGEPGRRVTAAVPLASVVQAGAAEIEDYHRIDASSVLDVGIAAHAVRDLIHLLAELFENATGYSPPSSRVRISARRAVDGIVLTIFDEGIGMPAQQVTELNKRLARPAMLTAELAGTMGLLVVGRLAARHGVGVELRSSLGGGTAVLVALPPTVLSPAVQAVEGLGRRPALLSGTVAPPVVPAPAVAPWPPTAPATPSTPTPPTAPATPSVPAPPAWPVPAAPAPAPARHTNAAPGYPPATRPAPVTTAPAAPGPASAGGLPTRPVPGAAQPVQADPMALPRRRPGGLLLSGRAAGKDETARSERANLPPDPETIRARLSGLANGLAAAQQQNQADN
jgi:signal transduction histidine kinase